MRGEQGQHILLNSYYEQATRGVESDEVVQDSAAILMNKGDPNESGQIGTTDLVGASSYPGLGDGTYTVTLADCTLSGAGTGFEIQVVVVSESVASYSILNRGSGFVAAETIQIDTISGSAAAGGSEAIIQVDTVRAANTAPAGSLCLDTTGPTLWQNQNSGSLWTEVGGGGSGPTVTITEDNTAAFAFTDPGAAGRETVVMTLAAARAVTLPTTPTDGAVFIVKEGASSALAITVSLNDATASLDGVVNGTSAITTIRGSQTFQFNAATNSYWVV